MGHEHQFCLPLAAALAGDTVSTLGVDLAKNEQTRCIPF